MSDLQKWINEMAAESKKSGLSFQEFCDVLEIVSPEDAEAISIKAAEEVWNGKDYEEALKTGREEILDLIK